VCDNKWPTASGLCTQYMPWRHSAQPGVCDFASCHQNIHWCSQQHNITELWFHLDWWSVMVDQQLTRCTEIYSQMLYILVFQSVMKYFVKKRPLKFYWCFFAGCACSNWGDASYSGCYKPTTPVNYCCTTLGSAKEWSSHCI